MALRFALAALFVATAALAFPGGPAATAEAGFCIFEPDDPVGSARCVAGTTVRCVVGIVEDGACPV